MKKILYILGLFILTFSIFSIGEVSFAENIDGLGNITSGKTTASIQSAGTDVAGGIKNITWSLIDIIRYVFSGVLLIFIVYAGAQMIMSMGSNEEELSTSKRTLWYCIIGIFFINFPVTIYELIFGQGKTQGDWFNLKGLVSIIEAIINFLEIIIIGVAVFMIILTGIKLITSRAREEKITEAKNKILWVIVALIFVGFIEVWRNFLVGGSLEGGQFSIETGKNIFQSAANLALYLAGPVALFFLTLAGYYYITSTGDDERAKKGKSIVINTIIGVIILLCAYVLLNDLSLLNF